MTPATSLRIDAVLVDDDVGFSFSGLCQASLCTPAQLQALVDEGILQPRVTDPDPSRWEFHGLSLPIACTARRLMLGLQLDVAAVALVLDLMAENRDLRARLHRAGLA
jgi:hypothetical protein